MRTTLLRSTLTRAGMLVLAAGLLSSPTLALSPISPVAVSRSNPENETIWNSADAIVYGQITGLRLLPQSEPQAIREYEATILVRHGWKGALPEDQTLTLLDILSDDGGQAAHFQLAGSYWLFLKRDPRRQDTYQILRSASLPTDNPLRNIFAAEEFSREFELLEFVERKTGHDAEANRIQEIRSQTRSQRAASARQTSERLEHTLAGFKTDFDGCMTEMRVEERLIRLRGLQEWVQAEKSDALKTLASEIAQEINVAENFQKNGIARFR